MKKTIYSFVIIFFSILLLIVSATAESKSYSFTYGHKEIIFSDSTMDHSKMEAIANFIANEHIHEENTTYAIGCQLGHSIAESVALEIEHCVYDTAPRCVQKQYKVTYCTRSTCDYMVKDLFSEYWVYCCE